MGKKDKKSKSAEQKARVAAKQSKKAVQKEKKAKSKGTADSDGENEDLEAVLEEYAKQQAQFLKVEENVCEPPSPRSSSTFVGSPSNAKELFLFGGEYFNGAVAAFFNDLFVYHIERDEWRRVTSPNSPLPRSGHAWCRGGNAGGIYLFGGEFSSPKQGTFYHYNDFWRLDPSTREWTRLESKGKSPPARSGHRMTYFKNFIILFGGFQDTSQQTKYLQDLWIYDCQNYMWHNPSLPPATQKPDPRSSFSFLPHDSGAVLYGGYSRVKTTSATGSKAKGGNKISKVSMVPLVHQDSWSLRLNLPPLGSPSNSPPSVRWERRKKPTNSPNPARAGATQAFHKGRGILFGGVHDVEESEEGIDSEFFNQLFAWNIDRNRFFPLVLRRPKTAPKKMADARETRDRGRADEAELLRNLAALETKGTIRDVDDMDLDPIEEVKNTVSAVKPVLNVMPHPRFNAQLTVQNDTLYILGGTFERRDQEFTFAEMYAIDLGKMDGFTEIYRTELEKWEEDQEESESESDEDDDFDSEDEEDGEDKEASGVASIPSDISTVASAATADQPEMMEEIDEDESENAEADVADTRPHPRPFETLRDFFLRTSNDWQDLVLKEQLYNNDHSTQSIKEVKKAAFGNAETKWWDSREEVMAEEERQEEAGIGEVMSIADRAKEGGGANRRR